MRICIVGAGAIGGLLATGFEGAGHQVTVVARGAHLAAMRRDGLRLIRADDTETVARDLNVVDRLAHAGRQDVILLGVKAHQVSPLVAELRDALQGDTMLVPLQNGIPWWYFQRHGGEHDGRIVEMVDPTGAIARGIDPARIIGCVVYPAAEIAAPGVIRHVEGNRFPLGELDRTESDRVLWLAGLFADAGFKSPVLVDIRSEIWLKLWGNLSFNPISALTHSTLVDLCQFGLSRELAANMMREAAAVAGRLGITFRVPLEKRIAGAERVGHHKTSMLQDVESGRDPEIDALVGAVIELGRLTGTPTPSIDAVYALVKLLSKRISEERVAVRTHAMPATMPQAGVARPH